MLMWAHAKASQSRAQRAALHLEKEWGVGRTAPPALHSAFTHTCCLQVPAPGEGAHSRWSHCLLFSGACGPRLAKETSQKEGKPALVDMRFAGDRREGSQTKPLPSQSPAQWCSEHRRKMPVSEDTWSAH